MDFPKQAELADIGIREVVTENPRIPLAVAQQPGTDVNTMVNVSAVMGDQVVGQITAVESGLFLASAKEQALDKYLFDRYGLLRPGATPALGSVSFSTTIPAVSPFTIPINTVLSTATGIQFLTVVATPYPIGSTGPVVVAVRSLQAGLNQRAGHSTITNIVGTIPGQPTDLRVTNPLATSGGDDQMGDVQFRTVGRNFFVNAGKGTVTAVDHHALVTSSLVKLKGTCKDGQSVTEPLGTVQAQGLHYAEVRAFLITYYGVDQSPQLDMPLATVTTHDRFGLVTIHGVDYAIVDIGMRMLSPRELFNAQGFPADYVIDPVVDGKPLSKTEQVHKCGNSVCPPLAEALVRANLAEPARRRKAVG